MEVSSPFQRGSISLTPLPTKLFYPFCRLHREALKQSATDPLSGKIDINILTTGMSSSDRRRRAEVKEALAALLKQKGKSSALNYAKVLQELKDSSQLVSSLRYRNDIHLSDLTANVLGKTERLDSVLPCSTEVTEMHV